MSDSAGMVVASNRGPVTWRPDDNGALVPRRGFGGLVTALGGALQREPGTWVSVALSEHDAVAAADRAAVDVDAEGSHFRLRVLDVGERYAGYYDEVSNRLLWFTVHGLWGEPYEPSGVGWAPAVDDYLAVDGEVGEAVTEVAGDGDEIHLHDYHLCATPAVVRAALPDAPILHYIHTPWARADYLRRLPEPLVEALLQGMLAADVIAFSAPAWAAAFRECAVEHLGAVVRGGAVHVGDRRTEVVDVVLGVDADDLDATAASDDVARAGAELERQIDGRLLLLRVDRADLSKNVLRGLHAYELLLERHPEHRGAVWHYAHLNPSRQGVAEYRDYLERCLAAAGRIRERFGDDCLEVFVGDDYPRAVAALQRSDVLLANPVADGTNLVAKEGPTLNQRHGVLVLSPAAGAATVLGDAAVLANPYDVDAIAAALHRALTMDAEERALRAAGLRERARIGAPAEWLAAQREALARAVAERPAGAAG